MEQSTLLELYDKAYTIFVVITFRLFDFMNFYTVKIFVLKYINAVKNILVAAVALWATWECS